MAAAKKKAATFTAAQVEEIVANALRKALAPAAAIAPSSHSLRPCDPVLIRDDADELDESQARYKRSAGVVERVDGGAVTVDMDLDHKRVTYPASALKLLKA